MYKRVKGYKRAVYIDLNESRRLASDVQTLYKSMHGLGTDEANLIRVLATKTNTQMIALNREYSRRFGDKGNLVKWIGDDTSGDVKRVLTAMAKDEAAADADALKTAMKSVATSSDVLTDILCNRSLAEIDRIKAVFKRTNEEKGDLAKWVAADTSGDLRSILLALLDRGAFLAQRLHDVLTGPAPNESVLVRLFINFRLDDHFKVILAEFYDALGLAIDLTEQLESELGVPSVTDIKRVYFWLYNEPLDEAIRKAVAQPFGQLLLALSPPKGRRASPRGHAAVVPVEDPAARDAAIFREISKDVARNATKIIELLAGRTGLPVGRAPGRASRAAIDRVYFERFGRTMEDEILLAPASETRSALLKLARPRAVTLAYALHDALKGGHQTEYDVLVALLTQRSKKQIREAALVFEDIVGMPLIKVIRSDTRGWFEKTLCYIIREAFEERVHVPPSHVVLVRDIDVAS